jgi:hypothetical protein
MILLSLLMYLVSRMAQMSPPLRASNAHILTVRVLRARRAPGRSLPILLRCALREYRGLTGPSLSFVSILLDQPGPLRKGGSLPDSLALCIHDIPDQSILDEKAASC